VTYILLNGTGYVLDLLTQKGVPFIGPSEILLDREVRVGLQPAVSQVIPPALYSVVSTRKTKAVPAAITHLSCPQGQHGRSV